MPRSSASKACALLCAPRLGAGVDPLLETLRSACDEVGLRAESVALDPAASQAVLLERLSRSADRLRPRVLGGFSLGARLSALLAPARSPAALALLGYPFHERGRPGRRPGLEALLEVRVPTLIVQGERDAHGSRSEVRGYGPLPPGIHIHWVEDGNHRLRSRERSGLDDSAALRSATRACADFLAAALVSPRDE